MSNQKEKAIDYFERHQTSNECFITSDNRVFHTKGSAESFATTLNDFKVNRFTRSGTMQVKGKNTESDFDGTDDAGDTAVKLQELQALELVVANYQAMKEMVKYFKIVTENNKAETLITALTEYKLKNVE